MSQNDKGDILKPERVLIIVAHPDDPDFGAGGSTRDGSMQLINKLHSFDIKTMAYFAGFGFGPAMQRRFKRRTKPMMPSSISGSSITFPIGDRRYERFTGSSSPAGASTRMRCSRGFSVIPWHELCSTIQGKTDLKIQKLDG